MIVRRHKDGDVDSSAWYSDCERYRYLLTRTWSAAPPWLFIGCNPSTATERANDPTIERMQRRAVAAGAGGLMVANANALRSTDPDGMAKAEDPTGPLNDDVLRVSINEASTIICGWGNHRLIRERGRFVYALILAAGKVPMCLKQNKDGSPGHPLYISYTQQPRPMVQP